MIDRFSQENHGVMEAALSTAEILQGNFRIESELWFPESAENTHDFDLRGAKRIAVPKSCDFAEFAQSRSLSPQHTVVVTHGCWQLPTKIGAQCKKAGYSWVYVPHGMLEPWSLRQKPFRKWIYWHFRERRLAAHADVVRATSIPEEFNLAKVFSRVSLISHGIAFSEEKRSETDLVTVLFMGRLHPKKGAAMLAEAWVESRLNRDARFRLLIVGNDDGDLVNLVEVMERGESNMELIDPIFGARKSELLNTCQFFALTSHSEGFPMALLEGMAAGLVPIITEGCNFPEALESGIGIRVSPHVKEITAALNSLTKLTREEIEARGKKARQLIEEKFSLSEIAEQQANLYRSLLVGS